MLVAPPMIRFTLLALSWSCAASSGTPTAPVVGHREAPPASATPSVTPALRCLEDPDPDAAVRWVTGVMDRTALRVCLNADVDPATEPKSTCRSIELGVPAMTREVAKQQPHQLGPKATTASKAGKPKYSDDGKLAIIDDGGNTSSLWEVSGDRRLAFKPPADVDATSYAEYRFLDQAVIVGWTPCAGPCTVWRAFRRDGKVIVNDIDDTVALLGMGAHRLATFGEKLEVYDVDSAKLVHSIAVLPTDFDRAQSGEAGGEGQADPLLELANGDLVVVAHGVASLEVVIANPDSGSVKRRVTIPRCDPAEAD